MNGLQTRLLEFSKEIVLFTKSVQLSTINRPIIIQLIRSATSVGANYTEAQSGFSKKDFRAKVSIAKKEAEETVYWCDVLEADLGKTERLSQIRNEAEEICKILQTILNKSKV